MPIEQQRYWPSLFEPELPGCPRCHRQIQLNDTHCASCGFELDTLLRALKNARAPKIHSFVDEKKILSAKQKLRILNAIEEIETKLPEIIISINVLSVPPQTTNEIYSFWWLNCAPNPLRDRHFTSLFIIDPIRPAISLSLGYRIEAFLPKEDVQNLLAEVTLPPDSTDTLTEDIVVLLSKYHRLLVHSFRQAHKIARCQKI